MTGLRALAAVLLSIPTGFAPTGFAQGPASESLSAPESEARLEEEPLAARGLELPFELGIAAVGVLELEAIGGNGPDDLVPAFGGTLSGWNGLDRSQNGDAIDRLCVPEADLSLPLAHPGLIVTLGKLASTSDLDTNRAANDPTTQFLSGDFTSSAAFQAPYRAAGVALSWLGHEHFGLDVVAMRPDNSSVNATTDLFAGGQLSLRYEALAGQGACNSYVWVNGERDDQAGLGFSLDQDVREDTTAFARLAWQEDKAAFPDTLARAWSTGLEWRGPFSASRDDAVGLGLVRSTPHDGALDDEGVFEAYFRHGINDHLEASFRVQGRQNPGGDPLQDRVFSLGVRLQVYL